MNRDLTRGPVMKSMLLFAIPMILGDLLQQCYNIADTLIVGQFLGRNALAAVGSAFTLMTFLTSIILGLCMGSGALFSMRFGQRDEKALCENLCASFFFIALVTALLNVLTFICLDGLRTFLRVPAEVWSDMREYLFVIFMGIPAVSLYNYFASFLRAIGNSVIPLGFLAASAVLNIALDLWFVIGLNRGVAEVLHRHIGKGVDFHSGGKGGHHNGAEAVDQSLYHKDTEVHDRLLHAGQRGEGDDLLNTSAPQTAELPDRAHLREARKGENGDANPRNILSDHRCLRRSGNASI